MGAWVGLGDPSLTLSARKANGPHPALSSPVVKVVRGLQELWGLVKLGGGGGGRGSYTPCNTESFLEGKANL